MKNEKKTIIIAVVVLLLVVVGTVGASYAYFATVNKTSGNDKDLNIVTEDLGSIKWEGTKVFESEGLLPGEMGIQTFTVDKNNATGKGTYEIDLKGVIDESFGNDVEISLYKSTNPTTDNVTIAEGESNVSAYDDIVHYSKEDNIVINGIPEKVYGTIALRNKEQMILEQANFDNSTFSKTTYYLVYHYKNNGDQNAQQGKSFSGEISVRLILDKDKSKVIGSICKNDPDSASCSVAKLANTNSDTVVDDFDNIRYIGSTPNNYVGFAETYYTENVYEITGAVYRKKTLDMREFESLEECQSYADENFGSLISSDGESISCNYLEFGKYYEIIHNMNPDPDDTSTLDTKNFDSMSDCETYAKENYGESVAINVKCSLLHAKGDIEKYELWRIIGVMHNVDDGTGNKSDRIKMVKDSSIGSYSWDTSDSSINNGHGVNEWSQAKLMKLLNPGYEIETVGGSLYWNNSSGNCYSGENNTTKSCDFTTGGLRSELKDIIGDAVWNTGAISTVEVYNTKAAYELERSENVGKNCTSGDDCNDNVQRTATWTGKVGLMYPSDYGYATSGGRETNRATCLELSFAEWFHVHDYYIEHEDCARNSWLANPISDSFSSYIPYNGHAPTSMLTPFYSSASTVAGLGSGGDIVDTYTSDIQKVDVENLEKASIYVRPTVYLKSNVKILSGDGSWNNPFILG